MTQTDTERVSYNFDAIYNLQLALTSFLKGGSALELRLVIHLDSKYHRFLSRWTQFAAILVAFRHQIHIQTLYVIPIQYMFQIFRRVASDMLFYGSKTPTRVGKKTKKILGTSLEREVELWEAAQLAEIITSITTLFCQKKRHFCGSNYLDLFGWFVVAGWLEKTFRCFLRGFMIFLMISSLISCLISYVILKNSTNLRLSPTNTGCKGTRKMMWIVSWHVLDTGTVSMSSLQVHQVTSVWMVSFIQTSL